MEKYVKIKVKELQYLLGQRAKLQALENGEVNNWEWYGEAIQEYLHGEYEDVEKLIKYNILPYCEKKIENYTC